MHQIEHLIVGTEAGSRYSIGGQRNWRTTAALVKRSNEALRRLDSITLFVSHQHPPDRVSSAGI
jgi:hypothetical protein